MGKGVKVIKANKPHLTALKERGTQSLSDTALLALMLDKPAEECAELLSKGLRGVADTCGDYRVQCALEFSNRFLGERLKRGDVLADPDAVRFYLISKLRDLRFEVFACLFLDNRHRVIAFEEMFNGTIDGASVYPREVVRRAMHHNAAAVIFAHNHPSGVPEPSAADERITAKLKDALHLIDVRVLDHFIIGDSIVSFAERGLI
jgi:DNA repair protein RadC